MVWHYYVGILGDNVDHAVVFRSNQGSKELDRSNFAHVVGPYESSKRAEGVRNLLKTLYKGMPNPVGKLYPKIDIYVGGVYVRSTNQAKNLKEAVARYKAAHIATGIGVIGKGHVVAEYAEPRTKRKR